MMTKTKHGDDKRLAQMFGKLSPDDKKALLAFAEFLLSRSDAAGDADASEPLTPVSIDPKPGESVVAAIKRLSRSYHMLDRGSMLNETSALMSAHVIQGKQREVVIEELEVLFRRYYNDYLKAFGGESSRGRA